MSVFKHIGFLIILWLSHFSGLAAQQLDWLRTDSATKSEYYCWSQAANHDGGVTYLITRSRSYGGSFIDTLTFDTFRIPVGSNCAILVKLDSNGKVNKAIRATSNAYSTWYAQNIAVDNEDAVYFTGNSGGAIEDGKKKYPVQWGRTFFAKFDKNLNLRWVRQDFCGYQNFYNIYHTGNRIVFLVRMFNGSCQIGNQNYNFSGYNDHPVFGELDTSDGTVMWSKSIFREDLDVNQHISAICLFNNRFYLYGGTRSKPIFMGTDTLHPFSHFVLRTDINGNYQMSKILRYSRRYADTMPTHESFSYYFFNIISDNTGLYLSCWQRSDTLQIDDQYFLPQTKSGNNSDEPVIISLTPNLGLRWVYKPKILDSMVSNFGITGFGIRKGILYTSITFGGHYQLGSISYNTGPNTYSNRISLVFELNNKGELLNSFDYYAGYLQIWNSDTFQYGAYSNMTVSPHRGLYLGSHFQNQLQVGDSAIVSNSSNFKSWVARVLDNEIHRGIVSSGPYCAGDSIFIPFTKKGEFDTSNNFVAELSDEFGDFKSKYYTLGFLKGNKDGIIRGVIPLFNVVSSGKYRIRVRSSQSILVMSAYRMDTLKLLVYSRDTANPGKDVSICRGSDATLSVTGGTAWQWSPGSLVDDSTARTTKAYPTESTRYRIIVSDTSGCGRPDTAYKTVYVFDPYSRLNFKDTAICHGESLSIKAAFLNGDSNSYSWEWWKTENQYTEKISSGFGKNSDEISTVITSDSIQYFLILKDACNLPPDTQMVMVRTAGKVSIFPVSDSLICHGVQALIPANASGGEKYSYKFNWFNTAGDLISDSNVFYTPVNTNGTYRVKVTDRCGNSDSTEFKITYRPDLNATIAGFQSNDTLCHGQETVLTAAVTGGDSTGYRYFWFVNGIKADSGIAFSLRSHHWLSDSGTLIVTMTVEDGCSAQGDTARICVKVLAPLELAFSKTKDTLCYGEKMVLKTTATGGHVNKVQMWFDAGGNLLSGADSLVIFHSDRLKTGKVEFIAVLRDGCSIPEDTVRFNLTYLEPLALKLRTSDTCIHNCAIIYADKAGGVVPDYRMSWYRNGNIISTNKDSLEVNALEEETIFYALLEDLCSVHSDTVRIKIAPYPRVQMTMVSDTGCEPFTLQLRVSSLNNGQNRYAFSGNNTFGNMTSDSVGSFILNRGKYLPEVIAVNSSGCADTFSYPVVVVHPKPQADFIWSPMDPTPSKALVKFYNTSMAANRYEWLFNIWGTSQSVNPQIAMNKPGEYDVTLIAYNQYGCSDSIVKSVRIFEDFAMYIPNTFTPDSDGKNDVFAPAMDGADYFIIKIYNRWGEQIFLGSQNQGWDGTYYGELVQQGLYLYQIEVKTDKGRLEYFNGIVNLLH